MRLYKVTHNDGGWHTGASPSELIIARSPSEAKETYLKKWGSMRNKGSTWASLIKFPGYAITVTKTKKK